jgi:hypothetical protein
LAKKLCQCPHCNENDKIIVIEDNDNDFKIAQVSDFFSVGGNDKFLTNQRAYTSYRIVIVV